MQILEIRAEQIAEEKEELQTLEIAAARTPSFLLVWCQRFAGDHPGTD